MKALAKDNEPEQMRQRNGVGRKKNFVVQAFGFLGRPWAQKAIENQPKV